MNSTSEISLMQAGVLVEILQTLGACQESRDARNSPLLNTNTDCREEFGPLSHSRISTRVLCTLSSRMHDVQDTSGPRCHGAAVDVSHLQVEGSRCGWLRGSSWPAQPFKGLNINSSLPLVCCALCNTSCPRCQDCLQKSVSNYRFFSLCSSWQRAK